MNEPSYCEQCEGDFCEEDTKFWCESRMAWYCEECMEHCGEKDCDSCDAYEDQKPVDRCEYCKLENIECTFWDYICPEYGHEYSKALCAECRFLAEAEVKAIAKSKS